MKVKFCGINKPEYARMAINLGADYLGFLVGITHLAEDKLTNAEAARLIDNIDFKGATPIAVTHLQSADIVIKTMREINVSAVQLHDTISIDDIKKIRDAVSNSFIIKAVHVSSEKDSIEAVLKYEDYVDALLLDSRTKDRLGGTGLTHDWNISREIVKISKKPIFLAGGLNPDNLKSAIEKVGPYGVDVNSGIENNGEKVYEKMKEFIKIAREA